MKDNVLMSVHTENITSQPQELAFDVEVFFHRKEEKEINGL